MSKYDKLVNELLQEAHFGSPHEKMTGIKRQIILGDADVPSSLGQKFMSALDDVTPYGMGDKSGNVTAQDEYDEIVEGLLGDLELIKVDAYNESEEDDFFSNKERKSDPVYVYASKDPDVLSPLGILAHSEIDHGDETLLAPLSQWVTEGTGLIIGFTKNEEPREGKYGPVPILVDRGGESGRLYSGPSHDKKKETPTLSVLKIKKPATGKPSWRELAMGADDWEKMGGKGKFI